jgi:hypothetical protein
MDFMHLFEIEQWDLLQLLEMGLGEGWGGEMVNVI